MDREQFSEFRDRHYAAIAAINDKKGKDYAGDEDALANFKAAAEQLGLDPKQIWAVYAHKHWSAVMSYVKHGQVESEPIEGRIHDVILYCFLLLGLIHDDEKAAEPGGDEEQRCPARMHDQQCILVAGHLCGHRALPLAAGGAMLQWETSKES